MNSYTFIKKTMSAPFDINKKIVDCVTEIFTTMVMMEVASNGENIHTLGEMTNSITAMIGLAGKYKGVIAVHFPNAIALDITSSFLGMDVDAINEDVRDAVGEIANMVGGNIKTLLAENSSDINLSLPSTISGDSYFFEKPHDVDTIIVPFVVDKGTFHVELQMEK